jgi:hypothetical protein
LADTEFRDLANIINLVNDLAEESIGTPESLGLSLPSSPWPLMMEAYGTSGECAAGFGSLGSVEIKGRET